MKYYINTVLEWFEREMKVRSVRKELYALSDRELQDIGIVRCDIPFVAKNGRR